MTTEQNPLLPPFLSRQELAERLRCGVTAVDRTARREKFRKLRLVGGRRGSVWYLREDVEAYEDKRRAQRDDLN